MYRQVILWLISKCKGVDHHGCEKKDVEDIVEAVGGKENLDTATHCVTRLRLVLKDDDKVDKDRLSNNDLVKGQFKADNQYQIVIGPGTVDEVYKQFVEVTGTTEASKEDAKSAAAKKVTRFKD